MLSTNPDIEAWAVAARLLVESAYLLARHMEPGENLTFSFVIDIVASELNEAADTI